MQAWKLLFSSDPGLFTVAVFVAMFAMVGYFVWLVAAEKSPMRRRAREEAVSEYDPRRPLR